MTTQEQTCPRCGAAGSGNFCQSCGSAMLAQAPRTCHTCQAPLRPEARYCQRCGADLLPRPAGAGLPGGTVPWLVAGAAVVALVVAIVLRAGGDPALAAPEMANAGNAGQTASRPAPDISNMSPTERFDRLYARVMAAGASGDTASVVQFTPMALGAYQLLDAFTPRVRFRAAMLRLQVGDIEGGRALADTILAATPTHLLGLVIQGTAASFEGDAEGLARSYRDFLDHYDTERASGRTEYAAEDAMLTTFHQAAQRAGD